MQNEIRTQRGENLLLLMNTWREIEMSEANALQPLYNYKKLEREE